MAEAAIKLTTKTDAFQFLWLKSVSGFNPKHHCYDCLKGKRCELIPLNEGKKYPAGLAVEGTIEHPAPYAYLCGVLPSARGIADNVHILMEPDAASEFSHEDANIRVVVTGMRRLPIEPLPTAVQNSLPELFWRCRNFQAGWQLFPQDRNPARGHLRLEPRDPPRTSRGSVNSSSSPAPPLPHPNRIIPPFAPPPTSEG